MRLGVDTGRGGARRCSRVLVVDRERERERDYLGHLPVAGPAGQLLPLAQPTAASLPCRLPPLPGGRARARRARPRAPATSSLPGCLLLPWFPPATPRSPLGPLSLFLEAPPLCSFSLARTRTQPSPPTRTTAATGPPPPRRRVHGLRFDLLVLPVDSLDAGCLKTPSPASSSSPAAADPHHRLVAVRPSPSLLRRPLQPP